LWLLSVSLSCDLSATLIDGWAQRNKINLCFFIIYVLFRTFQRFIECTSVFLITFNDSTITFTNTMCAWTWCTFTNWKLSCRIEIPNISTKIRWTRKKTRTRVDNFIITVIMNFTASIGSINWFTFTTKSTPKKFLLWYCIAHIRINYQQP
jgi:hypothetical protein